MPDVRIMVLHPNEQHREQILAAFRQYDSELELIPIADLRQGPSQVKEEHPAAVVVGVDSPNDPALGTVEAIRAVTEDVGIIVVSKEPTRELLVSCMRAGSDEFLEFPIDADELSKALAGLFKRKGIFTQGEGTVVSVFSVSGGAGVTTVACNLAALIAKELRAPKSSCIVDLNLQFGSVALTMDILEFSHTLADAAHEQERLDENLLATFMSDHESGVAVLPAPVSLEEAEGLDPAHTRSHSDLPEGLQLHDPGPAAYDRRRLDSGAGRIGRDTASVRDAAALDPPDYSCAGDVQGAGLQVGEGQIHHQPGR